MSVTVEERLWAKVEGDSFEDCWEFQGSRSTDGYGRISVGGHLRGAHRVAYELMVGEIPPGLVLDHLCRNPACVNPWHLEPVTVRENNLRGPLGLTLTGQCRKGHRVSEFGVVARGRGFRCAECHRIYTARAKRRYRARRVECPSCGAVLTMGALWNHERDLHAGIPVAAPVSGAEGGEGV